MFEVPQRWQFASVRAPLSLFAPVSSTVSCVPPLTRNLAPADPSPTPSGGGQAFQRQLPPAFLCSGQPSAMRFRKRAVPKTGFYGTEYAFGAQKGFLWYATRFLRHSATKKGSSGTRRIFKGALNSLLLHRMHFRKRKNGILLHRMHLQRPAEQPTP